VSKSLDHDAGRRRFIAGSAAAAGMAGGISNADAYVASTLESWGAARASVLVHDPRLTVSPDVLRRLDARGARTVALNGDPVWFWRSTAGAQLRDPATQLLGITGWAELLVFRGLAAETRRHLRHEKLAAAGTFIWLIA
jgi:hypothetical protein